LTNIEITSPLLNLPLISITPAGRRLLFFKIAFLAPASIIMDPDGFK